MGTDQPSVRRCRGHRGPRCDRDRHRGRELPRRADTARRDRRRASARAGGATCAAGARPALAVPADHEVVGPLHRRRTDSRARRDGVPARARTAARPGLPRAAHGRALRGSGCGERRPVAHRGADVRRPA